MERGKEGGRKLSSSPGESCRLRGATYWTKLAHIKQGSNWNSGGIRGSPRPGSRALSVPLEMVPSGLGAELGNETLDCASPYSLSQPAASTSPLLPPPLSASTSTSDITPPRSLSVPLSLSLLPSLSLSLSLSRKRA